MVGQEQNHLIASSKLVKVSEVRFINCRLWLYKDRKRQWLRVGRMMRDPRSPDETLGCQISPIHSIELHILYSEWYLVGRTGLKVRAVFCNPHRCLYREREGVYFFVPTPSCFNKAARGLIVPGVGCKGGWWSHGLRTIWCQSELDLGQRMVASSGAPSLI